MSKVLENMMFRERLGDLCLFRLEKEGSGNPVFQYLKDSYREDRGALLTRIHSDNREWAQVASREIPSGHKKTIIHHEYH